MRGAGSVSVNTDQPPVKNLPLNPPLVDADTGVHALVFPPNTTTPPAAGVRHTPAASRASTGSANRVSLRERANDSNATPSRNSTVSAAAPAKTGANAVSNRNHFKIGAFCIPSMAQALYPRIPVWQRRMLKKDV
jgi:hypothetical protein